MWLQRHNDSLIRAVISGNLDSVERAVRAGGEVDMSIRRRCTLLHVAALHTDNAAVAEFLVRHGVSPNATNDDGNTALAIAHRQGHHQIAAYLRSPTSHHKTSAGAATTQ